MAWTILVKKNRNRSNPIASPFEMVRLTIRKSRTFPSLCVGDTGYKATKLYSSNKRKNDLVLGSSRRFSLTLKSPAITEGKLKAHNEIKQKSELTHKPRPGSRGG